MRKRKRKKEGKACIVGFWAIVDILEGEKKDREIEKIKKRTRKKECEISHKYLTKKFRYKKKRVETEESLKPQSFKPPIISEIQKEEAGRRTTIIKRNTGITIQKTDWTVKKKTIRAELFFWDYTNWKVEEKYNEKEFLGVFFPPMITFVSLLASMKKNWREFWEEQPFRYGVSRSPVLNKACIAPFGYTLACQWWSRASHYYCLEVR